MRVESTLQLKPTNRLYIAVGSLLAIAAAVCLALMFFAPSFRLGFYLLYALSVVSSAACFRVGLTDRAFGTASLTILGITIGCFFVCAILAGPVQHNTPSLFGANEMTNFFELIMYPVKFIPLTAPAIACWILAAAFEKWHIALHIIFGLLLSILAIVNLNICLNIALNPEVLNWFFD